MTLVAIPFETAQQIILDSFLEVTPPNVPNTGLEPKVDSIPTVDSEPIVGLESNMDLEGKMDAEPRLESAPSDSEPELDPEPRVNLEPSAGSKTYSRSKFFRRLVLWQFQKRLTRIERERLRMHRAREISYRIKVLHIPSFSILSSPFSLFYSITALIILP